MIYFLDLSTQTYIRNPKRTEGRWVNLTQCLHFHFQFVIVFIIYTSITEHLYLKCPLNIEQQTSLEQMCFKKYLIGQISLQHLEGKAHYPYILG